MTGKKRAEDDRLTQKDRKMTKVLVTGANGFIGVHLASELDQRGEEVRCLVRRTSRVERLQALNVQLVYGDVRDAESLHAAITGVQVVYHLAGLTRALSLDQFLSVNQQGVENVARACAAQENPPVLVVVSSLAAAGPSPSDRLRTELDPVAPVSDYGRSKLAGEQRAAGWADEVPTTIVRPPIVLGGGDTNGLMMFRSVARRGVHIVPAMGNARVSIIHVQDLVNALLVVASQAERISPEPGGHPQHSSGIYYVAHDDHPTYADLGNMIGAAVDRSSVRVVHVPRLCVKMASFAGDWIGWARKAPTLVSRDKFREATAGSWTCSPQRIRESLGYAPEQSLAKRLHETAAWYQAEGWL